VFQRNLEQNLALDEEKKGKIILQNVVLSSCNPGEGVRYKKPDRGGKGGQESTDHAAVGGRGHFSFLPKGGNRTPARDADLLRMREKKWV